MSRSEIVTRTLNSQYAPLFCMGLLFLFAGHYYQLNDVGGYALFLPFNSTAWMAAILLVGVALVAVGCRRELVYTRSTQWLFISCLLLTLPLAYPSALPDQALLRILGLWAGFLLFASLQQFKISRDGLDLLLILIVCGIAIELSRYWYSLITTFWNTGNIPVAQGYPLFGVFQQRNVMASFVASGLVLSAYLLARLNFGNSTRYIVVVLLVIPFMSIQVLYAMASRAGWYGAMVGILLMIPYLLKNCRRAYILLWSGSLALGFLLSFIIQNSGSWVPIEKEIFSLAGPRTVLFPQAISMFLANPLFGVGYGAFESSYIHFVAEAFQSGLLANPSVPNTFHPHNEILYWAVEGGMIALAGLLLAACVVFRLVLRLQWRDSLAISALFFPVVLHSQVEFPFYASVLHFVIFIVLIHYVDASAEARMTRKLDIFAAPLKFIGVLLPLLVIALLIANLRIGYAMARFNAGYTTLSALAELDYSPVWDDRIQYAIASNRLMYGIANRNEESIRQYIDWAPELLSRQPRPRFYEHLIIAYLALNERGNADQAIREFRLLFPHSAFEIVNIVD